MSQLVVDAFIEIPTGSRNQYKFDARQGFFRLDQVVYSPVCYPVEYGHVKNTRGLDGDPLDVLVWTRFPTFPGCVIASKIVGVLIMSDDKGQNEKLLGVPKHDPWFSRVNGLDDLPQHLLKEISHFFQIYKDLENKKNVIEGWEDVSFAKTIYEDSMKRGQEKN
ncbi:inorganic diphosphatase [Paenibacillus sp. y28]|uniref:inorganic diphosphatase n=1 Tax=Paenibacillus sp. y28 TaxID=3129110 RepID=UPI003019FDB7